MVLEEDGSGLWDKGMEVNEAEVWLVEGLSKLLASSMDICRDGFKLLTELAGGEFMILPVEGGIYIVADMFWIVHGGCMEAREAGEALALGDKDAKVSLGVRRNKNLG